MIIYRLWDPVEEKFYSNSERLYANNKTTIWTSKTVVEYLLGQAQPDIKGRLVIRAYELVEVEV